MLTNVPWYLWMIALAPAWSFPLVWWWARFHPPFPVYPQGSFSLAYRRWHQLAVAQSIFLGPLLTILYSLMLSSSASFAWSQRHHAVKTLATAQQALETCAVELPVCHERMTAASAQAEQLFLDLRMCRAEEDVQ